VARVQKNNLASALPKLAHFQSDAGRNPRQLEIARQVEQVHKTMTKRVVFPGMIAVTISYYVASINHDKFHYLVLAGGIAVAALNGWITNTTEGWQRKTGYRTDAWDAGRWLVNLVIVDLFLTYALRPPLVVTGMVWTLLVISSQSDLFRKSYRNLVTAAGIITASFATIHFYPDESLRSRLFACFALGLTTLVFAKMEEFWCKDLERRLQLEQIESDARARLHAAEKNAQIGMQARTIAHELGNLIQTLELSATNPGEIDRTQLTRSLYFIKRINRIVLRDIDQQLKSHVIRVQELVDDVELLLRPDAKSLPCRLIVKTHPGVLEMQFGERPGTLFLIIQNLVRNAIDAIAAANMPPGKGLISLDFTMRDHELRVEIMDNGVGMTESEIDGLFKGTHESKRAGKHGLGFLFVRDEAARNKIRIEVTSRPDFGTTFVLFVPIVAATRPEDSDEDTHEDVDIEAGVGS